MLTEMCTRWSFEGSHCWWLCFLTVGVKMEKPQPFKETSTFKTSILTSLPSLIHSSVYGFWIIISFTVEKIKTCSSHRNAETSGKLVTADWDKHSSDSHFWSFSQLPVGQRQLHPASSWVRAIGLGHHYAARLRVEVQKALFAPEGQLKAGTSSMGWQKENTLKRGEIPVTNAQRWK